MRFICRLLLLLHPPRFRRRFGAEMLLIFDESPKPKLLRNVPLLIDGIASLARQWLLRSGLWKWVLAPLVALLTLLPGLALVPKASAKLDGVRLDSPVGFVMVIALASVPWLRK